MYWRRTELPARQKVAVIPESGDKALVARSLDLRQPDTDLAFIRGAVALAGVLVESWKL
jgi:hypothetical protein